MTSRCFKTLNRYLGQHLLGQVTVLALLATPWANRGFAESGNDLPPNWKAGGNSREGYYHEENNRRGKRLKRTPSDREQTNDNKNSSEAEFQPIVAKTPRSTLALFASSPELVRIDYHYSFSPYLALTLGASGPMPVDVEVSMPSDIIKADQSKSIAVAYPAFDINFKVDWGPYIHTGVLWHPFGGKWYTSFSAGIRSIRIVGKTSSPLRICSIAEAAKEPPCGNDAASIQTRNVIALDADIRLVSTFGRIATGWIYNWGPAWAISAELGVLAPISTKDTSKVRAAIVAPDGTPEDLSGALGELRSKSEVDLAEKAKEELGRVTNKPLPVAAVGVGYRF